MSDLTLPELGENISAGDVLRVLVKAGDTLAKDQPVLELETDKATIEVPSSVAGTIGEVKVKPGDKVKVGQVILTVVDGGKAEAAAPAKASTHRHRRSGEETERAGSWTAYRFVSRPVLSPNPSTRGTPARSNMFRNRLLSGVSFG